MTDRVVIVGAGLAGARCAETLRAAGFAGRVQLVGEEPVPPYERPALSKELLAGDAGLGDISLRPAAWWRESGIELVLGRRVEAVDVAGRTVSLQAGDGLAWDALVIATGSRARRLPGLPAVRGIHYLRSLQNALALRSALRPGRTLVVVGAGFVGAEVASTASELGVHVTLVSPSPPFARVLGEEVSALLARRYRDAGIDLRAAGVDAVEQDGPWFRVRLSDGSSVSCDAVLVAIGAEPTLPAWAGAPVANGGIVTDAQGRTGIPGTYACGDVACSWHPLLRRHARVEHWADAASQGASVAWAILGEERPHEALPTFWSDQFGLRLQYVGHAGAWSSVELEGEEHGFSARYKDAAGRPVAALVANRPRELGLLRRELVSVLAEAA